MTSATISQSAYCPSSTSSLRELSLIGLKKSWMKDSHASKQGFEKEFSTIDHIHTVSKLIKVSRERGAALSYLHRLEEGFGSVETEAVVEALNNQGVPTQYIKELRELYSNFTTGISPFYKNIIIDVKREGPAG
ncbi:hypothetical protein RB195_000978 [Necator americanus]|uniref:Uncharacterized protein n=1 Tax=Necator americanus TaxID=51031 RepID=A0ABR1DDH3_NECAM